jgi:hypothetical protein
MTIRLQVCLLLAKHAGKSITRDLAREMVNELFPDRSHRPEKFGQQAYEGYTLQLEYLATCWPELQKLHAEQYAETEKYRAGIPMNPDYDVMTERETAGGLMQFTARSAQGELVGHMRIYVTPSAHTQTLVATEDTLFITKAHRGGFLAVRLWQFAEASAIAIGVREIYFDAKLSNRADALARYLKYQRYATRFCRIIPEPPKE